MRAISHVIIGISCGLLSTHAFASPTFCQQKFGDIASTEELPNSKGKKFVCKLDLEIIPRSGPVYEDFKKLHGKNIKLSPDKRKSSKQMDEEFSKRAAREKGLTDCPVGMKIDGKPHAGLISTPLGDDLGTIKVKWGCVSPAIESGS